MLPPSLFRERLPETAAQSAAKQLMHQRRLKPLRRQWQCPLRRRPSQRRRSMILCSAPPDQYAARVTVAVIFLRSLQQRIRTTGHSSGDYTLAPAHAIKFSHRQAGAKRTRFCDRCGWRAKHLLAFDEAFITESIVSNLRNE
jgi:hypothetical protein